MAAGKMNEKIPEIRLPIASPLVSAVAIDGKDEAVETGTAPGWTATARPHLPQN
jgi:hypothetical protein